MAHRACPSVQLNMHPNRQFPHHFVVYMPCFCMLHFVSCSGGAKEPSLGVCSLGEARIPLCTAAYLTRGAEGASTKASTAFAFQYHRAQARHQRAQISGCMSTQASHWATEGPWALVEIKRGLWSDVPGTVAFRLLVLVVIGCCGFVWVIGTQSALAATRNRTPSHTRCFAEGA